MRVLKLTLKAMPFEVMVTGEKRYEYRRDSSWLRSRLLRPSGRHRSYDLVEFTNGYGSDRPRFVCEFLNARKFTDKVGLSLTYSNGLIVRLDSPLWVIGLGRIVQVSNWDRII